MGYSMIILVSFSVEFTGETVLANAVARSSVYCRMSSVTLVHPTQLRHLEPWASADIHRKFYGDLPRGTPPSRELNTRGVAKYSDFGPIEGYISETVQDRWFVGINH